MQKKIWLLINTVRYLKPIQIFYQIFYRLRPVKNLNVYLDKTTDPLNVRFLSFDGETFPETIVEKTKKFEFLNLEKTFPDDIDWDFQAFGKLWNYNLQYLNYLNNSNLPKEVKLNWLGDIGSWLKNGKLKLEPYPVSLRVMNTIRFCSKEGITDQKLLSELKAQVNYLDQHLEYHLLGNHLLENAFALVMSGYFFEQNNWKRSAKATLYKELEEQILNDGGHFELSPMYHQIILFRILELIDWCSKVNDDQEFLIFLNQKALKMCSFLKEITFSNGDIPHFNDSANTIALSSEQLLDYAKRLGIRDFVSVKLEDSGFRSFGYLNYKCLVDVGAVGPAYQPGHSHADALSFILYYKNQPLLVEVGTSTYQIGKKRSLERSTAAHNTVVIANTNQSQVWGGFRVGKRAKVSIIEDNENRLIASHNGYLSNFGVLHKREFIFSDSRILITDDVGDETGEANFHFHPDCNVELINEEIILKHLNVTLTFNTANSVRIEPYEYANGFNRYRLANKVIVKFDKELTTQIKF